LFSSNTDDVGLVGPPDEHQLSTFGTEILLKQNTYLDLAVLLEILLQVIYAFLSFTICVRAY